MVSLQKLLAYFLISNDGEIIRIKISQARKRRYPLYMKVLWVPLKSGLLVLLGFIRVKLKFICYIALMH